jgi:hypothetical protein
MSPIVVTSAWRRGLMGNADVGNRGQANLAFALISLKRGNKGVEHRRAIDAEGHSRRERDAIGNPMRRRYAPALLDAHDRVDGQARIDDEPSQRRFFPKAQLRRQ